jgi:predicted NAD-dependent protein-ADP-ribosyltransferase YbiA (DUF1768 family)
MACVLPLPPDSVGILPLTGSVSRLRHLAEQLMMAEKAALFSDRETRAASRDPRDPRPSCGSGAWAAGSKDRQRFSIAVRANLAKFPQHHDLRRFLLGIGAGLPAEKQRVFRWCTRF